MKKLTKNEMKKIIGGIVSSCGVECKDKKIHTVDCGTNACNTTLKNTVECSGTSGGVISETDPCSSVSLN